MKRFLLIVLLAVISVPACKKEDPYLVQNNGNNGNNGDENNGTTAPNNGTTAPNNGTTAPNNGTTAPNNGEANIIPADENRDYTGTLPTPTGTGAVEEFVFEMNTAQCEATFACRGDASALYYLSSLRAGDVGDCVRAVNAYRSPVVAQKSADAGRTVLDPTAAASCLADIAAADCSTLAIAVTDPFAYLDSCKTALTGTAVTGADCHASWDCGAGTYCSTVFAGCFGSCQDISTLQVPCGDTPCAFNQICDENLTCVSPRPAGESCLFDSQCESGMVCAPGASGNVCTEFVLVDDLSDCGGKYLCRPGLSCDGQTCGEFLGSADSCDGTYECAWDMTCASGACAAAPTGAAVCDDDEECGSRRCVDGGCIPVDASCYEL